MVGRSRGTTDLLGVMKQIGFGALLGYSVFVGLFNVEQKRPVRKPALLPATGQ